MFNLYNKYIFTPGPVKMYESTLKLGSIQTPYFRNEEFSQIVFECEKILLEILNAPKGSRVLFLTASGTAGMEASIQNLLNAEDKALVINGGGFGQRFVDICNIHNIKNYNHQINDNNLKNTEELEVYKDATALLVNSHETSVGILYDLESIGKFTKKYNILNIVDAISMFITDKLDMQEQNIDVVITSSHKGLALPPGLTMVVLSPTAIKKINPKHQLYFDFNSYIKDGERGQTPFTPAVLIILQLHDRLLNIKKEGISFHNNKARDIAEYFRKEIEKLPLEIYSNFMPNAMTTLSPLDEKSASDIVRDLVRIYNCVLTPNGGELKDKVFRVSHMGDMTKEYVDILIDALYDYYKISRGE